MQTSSLNYSKGQIFFYGNKKVVLLDAKPQLFYAKIRFLENNKVATINIKVLSKHNKEKRTVSLGVFHKGED